MLFQSGNNADLNPLYKGQKAGTNIYQSEIFIWSLKKTFVTNGKVLIHRWVLEQL